MIYTITFSPSIDYLIEDNNDFNAKGLNRIKHYNFFPGGKGINASVILTRLNIKNKAIYFGGGITCNLFDTLLKKENLHIKKIGVQDNVRINVKYFNDNQHFEINGPKPKIDFRQQNVLVKMLNKIKKQDLVLIMGQCDNDLLLTIIDIIVKKQANFVIDIDDKIIWDILQYKPLVIKPNIDELSSIQNKKIISEEEIIESMKELKLKGAKNVIISCGDKGSYLLTESEELYKITLNHQENVISTVGAGDTLLSSFIAFILNNENYQQAITKATALSLGTVSRQWLAIPSDIDRHIGNVIVTKI